MTTKKRAKRPTLKEKRAEKRDRIEEVTQRLVEELDQAQKDVGLADLLVSVAEGLYGELDKLSRKAPVDPATDLLVEQVNNVINDVRSLAPEDPYIQRVSPFVPAGDNPEHRDVIVMLKQVQKGLERCRPGLSERKFSLSRQIMSARSLMAALTLYIEQGDTQITAEDLGDYSESLSGEWWQQVPDEDYPYEGFKIVDLNQIDALDPDSLLLTDD